MKTNLAGIELIKTFEGYVDHVYPDAIGVPTIYYGHVVRPGESFNGTSLEATAYLTKDLAIAEAPVSRLIKVKLNSNPFSALVSFVFNLGSGALQASTLRRMLNRGEYGAAAGQFRRWVHAGGVRLRGLVRRRAAEKVLFLS